MSGLEHTGITRRGFMRVVSAIGMATALPWPCNLVAEDAVSGMVSETTIARDPMRPQFHLLPARNWMNDPNGPIYFDGHYHMFFQYNPLAALWGDMSWNHAISTDMIHWKHLPVAMTPTANGPDAFGCFSGSCLAVGQRVYAVYTGVVESTPQKATIRDGSNKLQESQCLAYSDDKLLEHWTKLPRPIVPEPPPGMQITGFRDPSAWKQGNYFYMTVGSGIAKQGGVVLLYRSKDMGNQEPWEYQHVLASGKWSGVPASNPVDSGEMWECPEFFALDGNHVLIYSTEGKVFWQSGKLDEETMRFQPAHTGQLDLGAFYAPKTQLDAEGRRILWGWIPEKRPDAALLKAGWAGMMSLPRVLSLDSDGVLRMETLPTLKILRAETVVKSTSAAGQHYTLAKCNGELLCTAGAGNNLSLIVTQGGLDAELLRVEYKASSHAVGINGTSYLLQSGDTPKLHAYIDGSVLSVIVSDRVGFTRRFYYDSAIAPNIEVIVTAENAHAEAWVIKPISDDRLTTPSRPV